MRKYLLSLLLALQIWNLQAGNYYCKTIGIENGLTQSSITSIAYGDGALWIGTRFGLNVFTNGKLRTYIDDGSGKLNGNYVDCLFCDSADNVWVGTDKGTFRYDAHSDSFRKFLDFPTRCIAEIDGTVYFGGYYSISSYSYAQDKVAPAEDGVYTDIVSLYNYRGSLLSVNSKDCIGIGDESVEIPEYGGNIVMASELDGEKLYLAVMNVGIIVFDLPSRRTEKIYSPSKGSLTSEILLSLRKVGGDIWIGTDGGGLFILDTERGRIYEALDGNGFHSNGQIPPSITVIFRDPLDNVWLGSVRNGVVGLKSSPVKSMSLSGSGIGNMSENAVIWLLDSRDGNTYIGTDGNGVHRYTAESGKIISFPGQTHLKVVSIADFDYQRLVISIYNKGFFLMDRITGALEPFLLVDAQTTNEECFRSNAPTIYNIDRDRILFLAVNTYCYDTRNGLFTRYCGEEDINSQELIVAGGENGASSLIAYSNFGLFRIDTLNGTIKRIYQATSETGSINTAAYWNGKVFFGTNYGLFVFSIPDGETEKIPTKLFNRVSRLHYGTGGNLWIAADNTLFLYRNGTMEIVGENRGVKSNEILACTGTGSGSVLFGGNSGVIEIGTNFSYDTPENKKIELHDVSVAGSRVLSLQKKIDLRHNYSSLVLTVNLTGADPFENVLFRYSVSGGQEFISETYENQLYLPTLKPGRYRVGASYMMSNGNWSDEWSVLDFRVRSPWYKSVAMMVLYALIFIGAIALAAFRISREQVKRMEADFKTRNHAFESGITAYIDAHISEPGLNVNEIAMNMAMSRAALYNKVNAAFGKGVAELIEERRMRMAEELLRTTALSVLDVSEKAGYSTPRYFSTRFKQLHNGMTPLKYRQLNR